MFKSCVVIPELFSFRHHGAGVREVRFSGHVPEEEQELDKHPVEAGGGQAAGLGHELPGKNLCVRCSDELMNINVCAACRLCF